MKFGFFGSLLQVAKGYRVPQTMSYNVHKVAGYMDNKLDDDQLTNDLVRVTNEIINSRQLCQSTKDERPQGGVNGVKTISLMCDDETITKSFTRAQGVDIQFHDEHIVIIAWPRVAPLGVHNGDCDKSTRPAASRQKKQQHKKDRPQ